MKTPRHGVLSLRPRPAF